MAFLKRILDFYIEGSIHVALSCTVLVLMTQHMFGLPEGHTACFVFFGTIVGYNFVKYDALARTGQLPVRTQIKAIITLSCLSFFGVAYCFFLLHRMTQIIAVFVLAITVLYTLPFFPNRKNARNWKGIKIYIVALCWVGATVVLPVIDAGIDITADIWLKCLQRFLLVFVLILIFEIIDLKYDDPNLHTVPQQIGVKHTKFLGWMLLLIFYFLEFLRSSVDTSQLSINAVLLMIIAAFLFFANENRSKYYTSFWVESVPILWWLLSIIN